MNNLKTILDYRRLIRFVGGYSNDIRVETKSGDEMFKERVDGEFIYPEKGQ